MQDLAQGKSLAELVKGGWRADEDEVTRIAKELLNILDYLATRRPAVTHRFVHPSRSCYHGGCAELAEYPYEACPWFYLHVSIDRQQRSCRGADMSACKHCVCISAHEAGRSGTTRVIGWIVLMSTLYQHFIQHYLLKGRAPQGACMETS